MCNKVIKRDDIYEIDECFTIEKGFINYKRLFEKDDVVPISMEKLNLIILSVKKDLYKFIGKSIDLGFAQSMDAVERIYASVSMLDEADQWIRKAADKGYEPAQKRLKY